MFSILKCNLIYCYILIKFFSINIHWNFEYFWTIIYKFTVSLRLWKIGVQTFSSIIAKINMGKVKDTFLVYNKFGL